MERNRHAHFAGLLVLVLLVSGQALAQAQEPPDTSESSPVSRAIQMMQVRMSALERRANALSSLMAIDERVLANVIVMTDQECNVLGPDWRLYGRMGGRFPIGAGTTSDAHGEERTFTMDHEEVVGGAYSHQLTLDEMPSHSHVYRGANRVGVRHQRCSGGCTRVGVRDMNATPVGGNEAHNNMPPYVVMNFCHIVTESRD